MKKALAQNEGFKKEKEKANQLLTASQGAKTRTDALESQIANKKTKLAYYKEEAMQANTKAKAVRQELDKEILEKIKGQVAVAASAGHRKVRAEARRPEGQDSYGQGSDLVEVKELEEGKQFVKQ